MSPPPTGCGWPGLGRGGDLKNVTYLQGYTFSYILLAVLITTVILYYREDGAESGLLNGKEDLATY